MSWKCDFCQRTFSTRTSYTNHIKKYLKDAELSTDEELSLDVMMIDNSEILSNNEVQKKK